MEFFHDDIYAILRGFNNICLITAYSEEEIIQYITEVNSECHDGKITVYDPFLGAIPGSKSGDYIDKSKFSERITKLDNVLIHYQDFLYDGCEKNIFVIKNASYLQDFRFWRALISTKTNLEDSSKKVILISHTNTFVPIDFKRDIFFYDFRLPDLELRKKFIDLFLNTIKSEAKCEFHNIELLPKISAGLTLKEINAGLRYSISLYDNSKNSEKIININADVFKSYKEKTIEKNSKVKFMHSDYTFDDVCGLDLLKKYVKNRFKKEKDNLPKSGIILVGIPGTGKTMFANALANFLNIPSIALETSAIFNKAVGESEKAMKASIDVIDSIGECVLVIDEIEKVIGGVASSNRTDGGTANRVFETLLNWLNSKDRKAYVIATSNDIDELPAEFLRAGRWDNIFMVDMPNEIEIKETFRKKCEKYNVKDWAKNYNFCKDSGFLEKITGAEIEQLVIEYCYTLNENGEYGNWNEANKFVPKIYNQQKKKIKNIQGKIGQYISASEKISVVDENGNLI